MKQFLKENTLKLLLKTYINVEIYSFGIVIQIVIAMFEKVDQSHALNVVKNEANKHQNYKFQFHIYEIMWMRFQMLVLILWNFKICFKNLAICHLFTYTQSSLKGTPFGTTLEKCHFAKILFIKSQKKGGGVHRKFFFIAVRIAVGTEVTDVWEGITGTWTIEHKSRNEMNHFNLPSSPA